MKSNSLKLAAVMALATCAGPALAQKAATNTFTGWGIGLSALSSQNKFELNANNQPASGEYNTTTAIATLVGSYGIALGSQWVGTVGLSYELGNTDFGTVVQTGGAGNSTLTGKDHLSVSFAPGYRMGEKGLVYAKLASHQITLSQQRPGFSDASKSISGVGLGLGYAMALTPSLEMRAEYEAVEYDKQSGGAPKQNRFGLALLYKFY